MVDRNTNTVLAAQTDARAQAGTIVEAMQYIPATTSPHIPTGINPEQLTWAHTIEGGSYAYRFLPRGARLRIEDLYGEACVHILIYNAHNPAERLNIADTIKIPWQGYLSTGHPLLSGEGRVLMTLVENTVSSHDAFCGTTTAHHTHKYYGAYANPVDTPNGRDLFLLAGAKMGLSARDLAPSFSLFKKITVDEQGGTHFITEDTVSGAYVDLLAEMDVIILLANAPHPLDSRPEYICSPVRLTAWQSTPTRPEDPQFSLSPERERAYLNTLDYIIMRGQNI